MDLLKVCCDLYHPNYYYYTTELFYFTLLCSFIGYYFEYLPLSHLQFCGGFLSRFKGFKVFFLYYFTTPIEKVMDEFCKVWGLIDRFNRLCRQIASVVVQNRQ